MPTKRVEEENCGAMWSGWLEGEHPTVEDGKVNKTVCFSGGTGCEITKFISVKNCGSYYIYELTKPPKCDARYCGTD